MNNTPTPEQVAKLPRWAQDHIEDLDRRRVSAEYVMNKAVDEKKPSPIFFDEYVCGNTNERKRIHVQTHRLSIEWEGVWMDILLTKDGGQRDTGINLVWGSGTSHLSLGKAALIPCGYQSASIVSRENMRVR